MIQVCLKKRLVNDDQSFDLNVDFKIDAHEFTTLFGASGSGKTTILRMIAGLTPPDEGKIEVDGELWYDSARRLNLPVQQRNIGFVFQDYTLFPNMTVGENLRFAASSSAAKIEELLQSVHLSGFKDRRPATLSGGEKQRVAFLRSLIRKPALLLLDEPFSALNTAIRFKLHDEMLRLYERFRPATIFVSHDVPEVFKLSHRVLVLDGGKIIRQGLPTEVFAGNNISGKFKFVGEIVEINKGAVVNILTILIGQQLTKVVATDEEIAELKVGDKVVVASKAFNPMILKCDIN